MTAWPRLLLCALVVVASALGCGKSDPAAGSSGSGSPPQSACPIVAVTQPCTCDGSPGRQTCDETGWTACECVSVVGDGTAGSGGGGGGDAALDHAGDPLGNRRADIRFDWERKEGPEGPCEPGVYSGSYSCEYVMAGQMPPGMLVEGFVNITLTRSEADGEVLVIADGSLDGNALLLITFTASLSGELTCSNDQFHADAVDGAFGLLGAGGGMFAGQLDGELNRATQTLSGTWALAVDDGMGGVQGTCAGVWTAVLQP